jgi:nicotinate-nucleotide adenylyltransferase
MEFFRRAAGSPRRLGVFAGTFNPPTCAHLALANAALDHVDEVLFVLPHHFPHKEYTGASFADRVRMLDAALVGEPRCSIAASRGGLFIEIAAECREAYGDGVELFFLCGRDAAERVAGWAYGRAGAFHEQLSEYRLLVAPRHGGYAAAPDLADRIYALAVGDAYNNVSATEVRERIRSGAPWEQMVPREIVEMVREIYGR